MRLIDADALMEVFRGEEGAKALDHFPLRLIKVKQIVDNAPTIDAIPVEWIEDMLREWHKNKAPFEAIGAVSGMLVRWQQEQEAHDG